MTDHPRPPYRPGDTIFESTDSVLIEASDTDACVSPGETLWTADHLLHLMRERVKYYGTPLPDGFVPPLGIDIDALLKQVPWPPTDRDAPPTA
ncbi:MAG TPA: hypothetical protein VFG68_19980 [Fimbriiglobus sp.]|nr:hypothetical protein [Fimbriiglobus sp.]